MNPTLSKKEQAKEEAFKRYTEEYTRNDICIRPDLYLLRGKNDCSHCLYYKYCLNGSKRLAKGDKRTETVQDETVDAVETPAEKPVQKQAKTTVSYHKSKVDITELDFS